jgi:hypothetical protein
MECCGASVEPQQLIKNILTEFNKTTRQSSWIEHSMVIKLFLLSAMSLIPKDESIAILGAGNCNDIDVNFLADQFNKVYMIDIDSEALEYAISKVDSSKINKIEIISEDLTGLYSSQVMIDFITAIKKKNYKRVQSSLDNIKTAIKRLPSQLTDLQVSLVISSCLTTQLFMPQFAVLTSGINRKNYDNMYPLAIKIAHMLSDHHIKNLYEMLKPTGYLIYITDFLEWGTINDKPTLLAQEFPDYNKINTDVIRSLHSSNFRIAGSAPNNILNYFNPVIDESIVNHREWWWEYSPERRYLVQGSLLEKKQN